MNRILKLAGLAVVFLFPVAAFAYPVQQLDIEGGVYDPVTETIVTGENPFTLWAVATAGGNDGGGGQLTEAEILSETFYLSVALTGLPEGDGVTASDFGSIIINGITYDSSVLIWGIPPTDDDTKMGNFNLAPHAVFPVWYFVVEYTYDPADDLQCQSYNTQDDAGAGAVAGTGSWCQSFVVDIGGITDDSINSVHFDSYTLDGDEDGTLDGDETVNTFSPFSKDAEFREVPEPGTLALLGLGLLALSLRRRQQRI